MAVSQIHLFSSLKTKRLLPVISSSDAKSVTAWLHSPWPASCSSCWIPAILVHRHDKFFVIHVHLRESIHVYRLGWGLEWAHWSVYFAYLASCKCLDSRSSRWPWYSCIHANMNSLVEQRKNRGYYYLSSKWVLQGVTRRLAEPCKCICFMWIHCIWRVAIPCPMGHKIHHTHW